MSCVKHFTAALALFTLTLSVAPLTAQNAEGLIKQGDAFDRKMQAGEALKSYLPAEKLEPNNVRLLTRIARQYRHMATDASATREKLRLGNLALDYAHRAAKLAPNDAEAQLSVAISYGKLLPILGNKEQVESSRHLKVYAERAVALDPKNDLAWHVLGRWHQVLADVKGIRRGIGGMLYGSLPATTNEEAVKCYERAIKLNPNRPRHYVELGRTYAQMGKEEEARKFIQKGLAMPNMEKDDPEIKSRGRETLAKL